MLYKLEMGHNARETTKKISCVEGKDAVDQSTVTKVILLVLQEP